jgi:hypothetical protein
MFKTPELKADMHAIRYAANNNQDIYLVYGIGRRVLLDSNTAKTMLQVYNKLVDITAILNFEYLLDRKPQELAITCWKIVKSTSKP